MRRSTTDISPEESQLSSSSPFSSKRSPLDIILWSFEYRAAERGWRGQGKGKRGEWEVEGGRTSALRGAQRLVVGVRAVLGQVGDEDVEERLVLGAVGDARAQIGLALSLRAPGQGQEHHEQGEEDRAHVQRE